MEKIANALAYTALATVVTGFGFALYQSGLAVYLAKAFAVLAGHLFA